MSNSQPASPFSIDSSHLRTHSPKGVKDLKRLLATACGIGAATMWGFMLAKENTPWPVFIPAFFMVLGAFAIHAKGFALQVFARSTFWANLLFSLMFCLFSSSRTEESYPVLFLILTGSTLLLLGRDRLAQSGKLVPKAFQGTLLLTLLFAFADIQGLVFWSAVFIEESRHLVRSVSLVFACITMCVALVGVLKLKVWGLALNLTANLVIAGCALWIWELPTPIVLLLSSTAIVQLFLATPLWMNMLGMRTVGFNVSERFKAIVPALIILALMGTGLLFYGDF